MSPWALHLLLSVVFVASRAALYFAGLRFNFDQRWMWLSDPVDLEKHLLETVYYFHAFPPGMDILEGLVLKIGGAHAEELALVVFASFGLVTVNSLLYLGLAMGLPAAVALGVAMAFAMLPQSIYFENLYLYEAPVAALLGLGAALFYRAMKRQTFWSWFAFFLACAAVGWIRSAFHLVWFLTIAVLSVLLASRAARRTVLAAAALPAALLLALYLKNFLLFGVFDSFTFGPVSFNLVTTWRLSEEVRRSWIKEGKLSPYAAVSVYAGPRDYLPFFAASENEKWPPTLNALDRPTVHAPNYNHWFFLEINRRRREDALYYLKERPFDYASTVLEGARDIFGPTTTWHPQDGTDQSPHRQHRQTLGGYEAAYNRIVHGFPWTPLGLYVFLPLPCAWALWRARLLVRTRDPDAAARGAVLYLCLLQMGYVVAASALFTFRESARYRYQIESMIWLIGALFVMSIAQVKFGFRLRQLRGLPERQ